MEFLAEPCGISNFN